MKVINDHYGIENINSNAIAMVLLAFILLVNLDGKAIKKVRSPSSMGDGHGRRSCIMALFGYMDFSRPVEDFNPVSIQMGNAAALCS